MYHPRKTKESQSREITVNSVNRNYVDTPYVVSLVQTRHEHQVTSNPKQATVCNASKIRVATLSGKFFAR